MILPAKNFIGQITKEWPLVPNSQDSRVTCANLSRRVTFFSKMAFGEYSHSPKTASFARVLKFAKFACESPLLTNYSHQNWRTASLQCSENITNVTRWLLQICLHPKNSEMGLRKASFLPSFGVQYISKCGLSFP